MSRQFLVIGLGTFGRSVAENLVRSGQSVLAIDVDEERVMDAAQSLEAVVRVNAADEVSMRELGLERVHCAVVAIGDEAVEASIMTTALLRQIGVPRIVARGLTELHERVLRAVGAGEVIRVEAEMGQRLARRLAQPNVLEWMTLGEDAELVEIEVPEVFVGKTLVSLDIRRRHGVTVVANRREGVIHAILGPDEKLHSGDRLIVVGPREAIERLATLA